MKALKVLILILFIGPLATINAQEISGRLVDDSGEPLAFATIFTANDPDFLPIDQVVYGGYGQITFKISKEYQAEVSGWVQSPAIWRGTFRTETLGSLNLAVQRRWNNWTAKLSFNDVLYTIPWKAENRFGNL